MERQKSIISATLQKPTRVTHTDRWLIVFIILFHTVGILGFAIVKTRALFLTLVPFHLLLMAALVIKSHNKINKRFIVFFIIACITGYGVEWIGTSTGLLFGSYGYGKTLGTQVLGVPLLMGVLWFLMVYSAGVAMRLSGIKHKLLRALTGAVLLTLLDWLIEPIAMRFDYWDWQNDVIPFTNYVCWFIISFVLLCVFELCWFKKQSGVAAVFLFTQFIFFIAMRRV
ncbi:MAG: carotenoid biosynthesis protein [Sphingobacteriaceae bacterium]|nr:MAG: carotenoid biosynthesis protein [Sphingobacteriaceae bacterium]